MVQSMKIYVGHSSEMDYIEELYQPLRQSEIDEEHEIVLPHEHSDEQFDSREFLRDECDLFVAEVSKPSIGLGIELGWADEFGVPGLCVHSEEAEISSSVSVVAEDVQKYVSKKDLLELIRDRVEPE